VGYGSYAGFADANVEILSWERGRLARSCDRHNSEHQKRARRPRSQDKKTGEPCGSPVLRFVVN